MRYDAQSLHIVFGRTDDAIVGNLADCAMRLVNEHIDVTAADLAKQMPQPSFDEVIPIVNLHEDGVANGHNIHAAVRRRAAGPSNVGRLALEARFKKIQVHLVSIVVIARMG